MREIFITQTEPSDEAFDRAFDMLRAAEKEEGSPYDIEKAAITFISGSKYYDFARHLWDTYKAIWHEIPDGILCQRDVWSIKGWNVCVSACFKYDPDEREEK